MKIDNIIPTDLSAFGKKRGLGKNIDFGLKDYCLFIVFKYYITVPITHTRSRPEIRSGPVRSGIRLILIRSGPVRLWNDIFTGSRINSKIFNFPDQLYSFWKRAQLVPKRAQLVPQRAQLVPKKAQLVPLGPDVLFSGPVVPFSGPVVPFSGPVVLFCRITSPIQLILAWSSLLALYWSVSIFYCTNATQIDVVQKEVWSVGAFCRRWKLTVCYL